MQIIKKCFLLFTIVIMGCSNGQDITNTAINAEPKPVGMVVTANPLATEAGLEILRAGGSAMDAAVAIQATLSLVEPQSSGFGGGGFGGGFGGGSRQARVKGSNLRIRVKLELKDILNGVSKKVKVKRQVKADGVTYNTCSTCNGQGSVMRVTNTILGRMQTAAACPAWW